MLASGADLNAPPGGHHRGAAVPEGPALGQRRAAAHGEAGRRPVLVEFWDFCRPSSLRTLPYLKAWHERYADAAACGSSRVHCPGFRPAATRTRCARRSRGWRSSTPSLLDTELRAVARLRQPRLARALPVRAAAEALRVPPRRGRLPRDRAGDPGAAGRRRRASCRCVRPEDDADVADRRPDGRPRRRVLGPLRARARCGSCSTGAGTLRVNGAQHALDVPGAHLARRARRATSAACSSCEPATGSTCHAVCFTPGLAGRPSARVLGRAPRSR